MKASIILLLLGSSLLACCKKEPAKGLRTLEQTKEILLGKWTWVSITTANTNGVEVYTNNPQTDYLLFKETEFEQNVQMGNPPINYKTIDNYELLNANTLEMLGKTFTIVTLDKHHLVCFYSRESPGLVSKITYTLSR